MGVFSTAGPTRPRPARHSVRFTFTSTVAVPTICMVLLWGLAAGIVLATPLSGHGTSARDHRELVGIVLIVAAGLVVVAAALILTGSFARRLSQDISGLAATAHRLADEQLPQLIEQQRAGEKVSQADPAALGPQPKTTEVADAVAAIASLQRTALSAATSGRSSSAWAGGTSHCCSGSCA